MNIREPITLHLFISDPEEFTQGDFNHCFTLRHTDAEWYRENYPERPYVCEIQVDLERYISPDTVRKIAVQELSDRISYVRVNAQNEVARLDERRCALLALEGPSRA